MIDQHTYVVLMCGGEGTRFAPLSTPEKPKQFLRLIGERSLLQETVDRIAALIPAERVIISTNERYVALVQEHLPHIPRANILAEPCKKNTAPALAMAAHWLAHHDPASVMVALPADHMISKLPAFHRALQTAVRVAREEDLLVTLGIQPDRPAVDYGYIERGTPLSADAFLVERFVEKPDHERALQYLASGRFYWNSGMFIWQSRRLLAEIAAHLPELQSALQKLPDIGAFFAAAPSISIDYGIMERSRRVATIPVECGWSDVGSWDGLRQYVEREGLRVNPDVAPHLHRAAS